ncbi:MAG: hypothetical protein IPO52_14750 [Gemmatimonadetes bacterium]|jgi:hypothetical protein|nr:hypothetical protein [Gemmatimonadota bacterium]
MQLDEFVKSTLRQIIHGVRDAQNELGADGAAVNPGVRTGPSSRIVHSTGTILQDVEFDIAVTVSESENSGSGLRVGVPWVSGKIEAGSDRQHSQVSRIKFVVPVAFPRQPGGSA